MQSSELLLAGYHHIARLIYEVDLYSNSSWSVWYPVYIRCWLRTQWLCLWMLLFTTGSPMLLWVLQMWKMLTHPPGMWGNTWTDNMKVVYRLLAQTTLRNILGTKDLHEILSDRESISGSMQARRVSSTHPCYTRWWCRWCWTRPQGPGVSRWRGWRCK